MSLCKKKSIPRLTSEQSGAMFPSSNIKNIPIDTKNAVEASVSNTKVIIIPFKSFKRATKA